MTFALCFLGSILLILFWHSSKKKHGNTTIPIIRNLGKQDLHQLIGELKSNRIKCYYKDEGGTGYFNAKWGQGSQVFDSYVIFIDKKDYTKANHVINNYRRYESQKRRHKK